MECRIFDIDAKSRKAFHRFKAREFVQTPSLKSVLDLIGNANILKKNDATS